MLHDRLAPRLESHRHRVEAKLRAHPRMCADPGGGGPAHLPSLGPGYRLQRMLRSPTASLDLDEGYDSPIKRHDVQLAPPRAPVSGKDLEAVSFQMSGGDLLAQPGEPSGVR